MVERLRMAIAGLAVLVFMAACGDGNPTPHNYAASHCSEPHANCRAANGDTHTDNRATCDELPPVGSGGPPAGSGTVGAVRHF